MDSNSGENPGKYAFKKSSSTAVILVRKKSRFFARVMGMSRSVTR